MEQQVVALDVGGANIKAASSTGRAQSIPFPLWRKPERLPHLLRPLLPEPSETTAVLVTMTAELCDCFRTKRDGVLHVLNSVEEACRTRGIDAEHVRVWTRAGSFIPLPAARQHPLEVAAANWLATAWWVAALYAQGTCLLVDTGSTTTDLTLIRDGRPVPQGLTDSERLLSRELVYVGVRRTPLPAVLDTVPFRGALCPIMAELFATSLDVFLVLEELPERPDDHNTADGEPATREAAHARLARLIGGDVESVAYDEVVTIARHARTAITDRIEHALDCQWRRAGRLDRCVLTGEGEFLLADILRRRMPQVPIECLAERLGPEVSRAACAHAMIELWKKRG